MKIDRATLFELPDKKGRITVCTRDDGDGAVKSQKYADIYIIDSKGRDILLASIDYMEAIGLTLEVFDSERTGPVFSITAPPDTFETAK